MAAACVFSTLWHKCAPLPPPLPGTKFIFTTAAFIFTNVCPSSVCINMNSTSMCVSVFFLDSLSPQLPSSFSLSLFLALSLSLYLLWFCSLFCFWISRSSSFLSLSLSLFLLSWQGQGIARRRSVYLFCIASHGKCAMVNRVEIEVGSCCSFKSCSVPLS